MSSSDSAPKSQEFKVHACGNLYKDVEHFIGKFTTGGEILQRNKIGWQLQRQENTDTYRGRPPKRPRTMPWELIKDSETVTHIGQPELGMTTALGQTNYFVLVKEGPNFTALPVKGWYTFRQNVRPKKVLSLEEAEQKMNEAGNNVQLNTNSRLGALAAKAETEGGEGDEGDEEGEQPDSDEERENQRAARIKAAQTEAVNGGTSGAQQTPPGGVQTDKGEKGEDWEHEDEHADDDLEQGEDEGSDQENPPNAAQRSPQGPDSDDDDRNLTEEGQEMNRILRKTRLSSGSDASATSSQDIEEEDDDDDLDLDAMASKFMPTKMKVEREKSPSVPISTDSDLKKKGKPGTKPSQRATPQPNTIGTNKRKAVTPPNRDEAKKARPEENSKDKGGSTQSDSTSGPPSLKEITDCLRAWGPITPSELAARFKKRVTGEAKKTFTENVKKISKLEERPPGSGKKFVVLRK